MMTRTGLVSVVSFQPLAGSAPHVGAPTVPHLAESPGDPASVKAVLASTVVHESISSTGDRVRDELVKLSLAPFPHGKYDVPSPSFNEMAGGYYPDAAADAGNGGRCATWATSTLHKAILAVGGRDLITGGDTYPYILPKFIETRAAAPGSLAHDRAQEIESVRDSFANDDRLLAPNSSNAEVGYFVFFQWAHSGDTHVAIIVQSDANGFWAVGDSQGPAGGLNLGHFPFSQYAGQITGYGDPSEGGTSTASTGSGNGGGTVVTAAKLTGAPGLNVPAQPSGTPTPAPSLVGGSAPNDAPADTPPFTGQLPGLHTVSGSGSTASSQQPRAARSLGNAEQAAFIQSIAPAAVAAQAEYGVPAAVTIAQAIDESGWGQSELATEDHNLFGIKGTGTAGSTTMPTREYLNGAWTTVDAQFRAYHSVSESIVDHAHLLARFAAYHNAMQHAGSPDAFADALTGVYATDPEYGSTLITLMKVYNLYQFSPAATNGGGHNGSQAPVQTLAQSATPAPGLQVAAQPSPAPTTLAVQLVRPSAKVQEALVAYSKRALPKRLDVRVRHRARDARTTLAGQRLMYEECADQVGVSWEILGTTDWLACGASLKHSPLDGSVLHPVQYPGKDGIRVAKTEALVTLAELLSFWAWEVYKIDLTKRLNVLGLARVFSAYRWNGLVESLGIPPQAMAYAAQGLWGRDQLYYVVHAQARRKQRGEDARVELTTKPPRGEAEIVIGGAPLCLMLGYTV